MKCIWCGGENVDALITVRIRIDADDYMHLTNR